MGFLKFIFKAIIFSVVFIFLAIIITSLMIEPIACQDMPNYTVGEVIERQKCFDEMPNEWNN